LAPWSRPYLAPRRVRAIDLDHGGPVDRASTVTSWSFRCSWRCSSRPDRHATTFIDEAGAAGSGWRPRSGQRGAAANERGHILTDHPIDARWAPLHGPAMSGPPFLPEPRARLGATTVECRPAAGEERVANDRCPRNQLRVGVRTGNGPGCVRCGSPDEVDKDHCRGAAVSVSPVCRVLPGERVRVCHLARPFH